MRALTGRLTERRRWILTGAITLALLSALVVFGVSYAFGALEGGYELVGRFDAAGQGLVAGNDGSDVQIRGVDVGRVADIELVDNDAIITVKMKDGQRVPRQVRAVIRPKTLFGEKFIDLEMEPEAERDGPFMEEGDEFEETLGGFELERVLSDAYPILEAIDPAELGIVLGELADAGSGIGPNINRSIVNFGTLSRLQVENDAETRQFLSDLALLSDELADRADDLVAGARDLNVALPPLNERSDELAVLLQQTARLSGDVADVLENNRSFLRKNVTEGGKSLQVLFDERGQIRPLVTGVRQYVQTLAEVIRLPLGDGTRLAAVKGITGGDVAAILVGQAAGQAALGLPAAPLPLPDLPVDVPPLPAVPDLPVPTTPEVVSNESSDIGDLLGELFGR